MRSNLETGISYIPPPQKKLVGFLKEEKAEGIKILIPQDKTMLGSATHFIWLSDIDAAPAKAVPSQLILIFGKYIICHFVKKVLEIEYA